MEKSEDLYSTAWSVVKKADKTKVITIAIIALFRSPNKTIWWHQVREKPLLNKIKVFSRGTDIGSRGQIFRGGHSKPVESSGESIKLVQPKKKEKKNITSLPMNQAIDNLRVVSISREEKLQWPNSHLESDTHKITNQMKIKRKRNKNKPLTWLSDHISTTENRLNTPKLTIIGHGELLGT